MPVKPDLLPPLHRKSLLVLRHIADLLESCAERRTSGRLLLEINLNQGVPSRLEKLGDMPREEIPLQKPG